MEPFSDGTNGTSHPHSLLYDVRARLQTLLDQKEQELQSAGSLGQRILAQQMELEERINQMSELESGRTGLKDDEIESEMRAKLNDLADTMHSWQHENQQLWSGFGPKVRSTDFVLNFVQPLSQGMFSLCRRRTTNLALVHPPSPRSLSHLHPRRMGLLQPSRPEEQRTPNIVQTTSVSRSY
jgi:hypothetical protein